MVRITKRGVLPETKEYEFVCGYCLTEFIATKGECREEYGHQRDPMNALVIRCPVCNREVLKEWTSGYGFNITQGLGCYEKNIEPSITIHCFCPEFVYENIISCLKSLKMFKMIHVEIFENRVDFVDLDEWDN